MLSQKLPSTLIAILFSLILSENVFAASASASSSDSDIRVGAYYGFNIAQPKGAETGVTINGKQGNEFGLMGWIPLISDYVDLRAAVGYKTAVKSYTDANLNPTSQFNVTEKSLDGAIGLQFSLVWDFYLFGEAKISHPTTGTSTVVTPGGSVVIDPGGDFLQAYGLGFALCDFSGIFISLEAEYDHGSKVLPLGEVNSFVTGQILVSGSF